MGNPAGPDGGPPGFAFEGRLGNPPRVTPKAPTPPPAAAPRSPPRSSSARPPYLIDKSALADLIVAAVAEQAGVVLLHYDSDFDRIAAVTGQAAEWVVPRGTV